MGIAESESTENYNALKGPHRDILYNTLEPRKAPYLELIFFEIMLSLSIGFVTWALITGLAQELDNNILVFLGPCFLIVWGAVNSYNFVQIRKYGLFFLKAMGGRTFDPTWDEPALLIKLRDPRVSVRRKCLRNILNFWESDVAFRGVNQQLYAKRLAYCLIDKSPIIRRIACEVVHKHFDKYRPVIAGLLRSGLDLSFYLVDRNLRKLVKEEPIQNIRFCRNLECFAGNEPCKAWPVSQTILSELKPYVYSLSPVAHSTTIQMEPAPHLDEGQVIGICRVCNLPLHESEDAEQCPICAALMHKSHFLEWLKIKGNCPSCNTHLNPSKNM